MNSKKLEIASKEHFTELAFRDHFAVKISREAVFRKSVKLKSHRP